MNPYDPPHQDETPVPSAKRRSRNPLGRVIVLLYVGLVVIAVASQVLAAFQAAR